MSGFDVNTVTVSGNLTRDPDLRSTQGGTAVCNLRIAHNERYKDGNGEWQDRAAYFDVTIWSGLGEWMGRNLSKGEKVVVSGRLKWREWKDRDGNNRQTVDIHADSVIPVPRGDGGGGGGGRRDESSGFQPRDDFQPAQAGAGGGPDDDIPF